MLVERDNRRPADDERRARFINQDRIHFVNDGVIMAALDLVLFALGHAVVAEIIEPELGIGAVGDVAVVLLTADLRRLVVQDAADGQAEELIDRAHPFAVARGEVIVDGDDVNAAPGKSVEINGQRRDEGFAFAGGHFGDAPAMEGVTADELHVEGNHFPFERMAADGDFLAAEAAAGGLDDGEGLGQQFDKPASEFLIVLDFGKLLLPGGGLLAQLVVREALQTGLQSVDLLDQRAKLFDFALVFRADELFHDKTDHAFSVRSRVQNLKSKVSTLERLGASTALRFGEPQQPRSRLRPRCSLSGDGAGTRFGSPSRGPPPLVAATCARNLVIAWGVDG